jgi:uncharacterized protein (DUF1499 family)
MATKTLAYSIGKPSTSWVVVLGACLGVASALTLLVAPIGYRLGVIPLRMALLTILRWGAYGAAATIVVSVIGLGLTLMRRREARRGVPLALASLVLGAILVGIPGQFRMGPPKPPIHDITTDTQQPPQYVAVLPLRANAPNKTEYEGEAIAARQREAYPEVQPLVLEMAPPQAFERELATVRAMGWDLVEADAASGRIEATDTTFWFGFKDDVVVRIRPTATGGSRIDVRSLSRVGGGDVGTNAKRILAYLDALKAG